MIPLENLYNRVLESLSIEGIRLTGNILDLGASTGFFAQKINQYPNIKIFAIDKYENTNNLTQLENVIFINKDLNEGVDFPNKFFDAIIGIEIIEHLENHHSFIRELSRILKPGGILLLTTPNILSVKSRLRFLLTGFLVGCKKPLNEFNHSSQDHINLIPYWRLKYILATNGFSDIGIHSDKKKRTIISIIVAYFIKIKSKVILTFQLDHNLNLSNKNIYNAITSNDMLFGRSLIYISRKNNDDK